MAKKLKLLYVDDEETLRLLVQSQLSREGYEVETADDGDTGIEALKKKQYDIILLDIRMPRLNGVDVLKFIRQENVTSRVIMLTAVDDLGVAIESVKHGANDYLTKPYDLDTLLASIKRVSSI